MAYSKGDLDQLNDVVYGAITKFYEKVIAPRMATKEDLEGMATKDDLERMATKDDIANMATKEDLEGMATKDDIARLEKKMDVVATIVTDTRTNHERRIRKIEEKIGIKSVRMLN